MSPEQAEGRPIDARSDLFSLGVILFEMLTGRRPFHGDSLAALLSSILRDEPPSARTLRPALPPELDAVLTKALAKKAERRYASASELAQDLERIARPPAAAAGAARGRGRLVLGSGGSRARRRCRLRFGSAADRARTRRSACASCRLSGDRIGRRPSRPTGRWWPSWTPRKACRRSGSSTWGRASPSRSRRETCRRGGRASRPRATRSCSSGGARGSGRSRPSGVHLARSSKAGPVRASSRTAIASSSTRAPSSGRPVLDGSDARKVAGVQENFYSFYVKHCAAVSPDGLALAYFQPERGPNGDLWLIPAAGGEPRRLTQDIAPAGNPVFARDGRSVIFSSSRAGSRTLWRVPVTGGTPEPVTTGAGEDDEPDLSRDGTALVYTNSRHSFALMVTDSATGAQREVLERRGQINGAVFSADGKQAGLLRVDRRARAALRDRRRRARPAAGHPRPGTEHHAPLVAGRRLALLLPGGPAGVLPGAGERRAGHGADPGLALGIHPRGLARPLGDARSRTRSMEKGAPRRCARPGSRLRARAGHRPVDVRGIRGRRTGS